MKRDITIFIECLAFFGLICCIFIYNASLWFLGVLIAFVSLEIIMEILEVKLKSSIARIYNVSCLLGITAATIISNGLQLSSIFPAFFVVILLFISQYGLMREPYKKSIMQDEYIKREHIV